MFVDMVQVLFSMFLGGLTVLAWQQVDQEPEPDEQLIEVPNENAPTLPGLD